MDRTTEQHIFGQWIQWKRFHSISSRKYQFTTERKSQENDNCYEGGERSVWKIMKRTFPSSRSLCIFCLMMCLSWHNNNRNEKSTRKVTSFITCRFFSFLLSCCTSSFPFCSRSHLSRHFLSLQQENEYEWIVSQTHHHHHRSHTRVTFLILSSWLPLLFRRPKNEVEDVVCGLCLWKYQLLLSRKAWKEPSKHKYSIILIIIMIIITAEVDRMILQWMIQQRKWSQKSFEK